MLAAVQWNEHPVRSRGAAVSDLRAIDMAARGNVSAQQFLHDLWHVCSELDDLHDKDKVVDVERLTWRVLVDLPSNAFYLANFSVLQPIVRVMVLNWVTSNRLQTQAPALAYTLRSSFNEIVTTVALLIGGRDWAQTICDKTWLEEHEAEPFEEYLKEAQNGRVD